LKSGEKLFRKAVASKPIDLVQRVALQSNSSAEE